MIIVCKNTNEADIKNLTDRFEDLGFRTHLSTGTESTIIGLIGDTSKIDVEDVQALEMVEKVQRVSEPFKLVNRKFHSEDTIIDVNGVKIGGGNFGVMAGPCSIESEEQIVECAKAVKLQEQTSSEAVRSSQELHHTLSEVLRKKVLNFF